MWNTIQKATLDCGKFLGIVNLKITFDMTILTEEILAFNAALYKQTVPNNSRAKFFKHLFSIWQLLHIYNLLKQRWTTFHILCMASNTS